MDGKVAGLDGKLESRDAALEKKLECRDAKLAKMIEESIVPRVVACANEDKGADKTEAIDSRLESEIGELKDKETDFGVKADRNEEEESGVFGQKLTNLQKEHGDNHQSYLEMMLKQVDITS